MPLSIDKDKFYKSLNEKAKAIANENIARLMAINARVLILDRVQQRGLDEKESPFKPYSQKPFSIPYAAFLNDKKYAFNQSALNKVRRLLKKKRGISAQLGTDEVELFKRKDVLYIVFGGGYKQFRELAGRQTNKVDMTFTSQMLNDFQVIPGSDNAWLLGFRNPTAAKKYAGNKILRGNFLRLSQNELEKLRSFALDEIKRLLS